MITTWSEFREHMGEDVEADDIVELLQEDGDLGELFDTGSVTAEDMNGKTFQISLQVSELEGE